MYIEFLFIVKAMWKTRGHSRYNIASKRDPELESQILDWIEEVLEARLPQAPYEEVLRDGVVLCK
ncbi:hypothetical protein HPB48_022902 [Haemaphysalis longicornis]|uniref:Calponin-homology (CH) domain-containing protein n=1 Tax=Haemaphysalis longicornis TaxID=44386 RepID=A0A9J6H3R6_HAELO|nr:hypothetical protein HPB48_022902 [Haemaphysalis longicornis]